MGGIGGDLITAWVESADSADHANLHSCAYSIRVLSSFLEKEGVGLDLATADDLRRFERKMHREHRGTTARSIVGAAKRFYSWASDQGVCRDVAKDALSKGAGSATRGLPSSLLTPCTSSTPPKARGTAPCSRWR